MYSFNIESTARNQMIKIDHQISHALASLGADNGIAIIFCPHTTGAITINENADPDVCHDWLENFNKLVPADQPYYLHAEGNSDSHVKCSMVGTSETVIIDEGRMVLGTWQSVYFAEFDGPRTRKVVVKFIRSQ